MDRGDGEAGAAVALRECRQALRARGSTVVQEAIGGAGGLVAWRHYPEGEVYDQTSHAQYFFHCHAAPPPPDRDGRIERGHFHLFLGADGMPEGIAPLLLPELAVAEAPAPRQSAPLKRGTRDEVCHLIALGVDADGEPIRLFTTNRWVTGEAWYRADDAIRLLDRFHVSGPAPSALLNRWLAAMLRLFASDIADLLRDRDKTITEWRWRRRSNVFEDIRLEIPSSLPIDLEARLIAVEQGTGEAPLDPGLRRPPPLPPMAEGWGA